MTPDHDEPRTSDAASADPGRSPNSDQSTGLIEELTRQRDDYLDQLQRSRAEFANYQKRIRTQMDQDRQYAVGPLALDLLPVLDNFERASEAARSAGESSSGLLAGLDMVQKQLLAVLAKHGIEPISAQDQPFDPNYHEALVRQPVADRPDNTVVAELSKGYTFRDRVLRPTKVAVSVAPGG